MRHYIRFPRLEGRTSRQAHADLPEGTFERELGKEGFFGPATQMYHRHPPTGWESWEGPLRPRAFDLNRVQGPHPRPSTLLRCSTTPMSVCAFGGHLRRWTTSPATPTATS